MNIQSWWWLCSAALGPGCERQETREWRRRRSAADSAGFFPFWNGERAPDISRWFNRFPTRPTVNQQTIDFIWSFVRQLPLPSGHSGSINAFGVETAEKWWWKNMWTRKKNHPDLPLLRRRDITRRRCCWGPVVIWKPSLFWVKPSFQKQIQGYIVCVGGLSVEKGRVN